MKIISFNQKWIFKNELKNIPDRQLICPMMQCLQKSAFRKVKPALQELISPAENTAIEKTCSGQKSTGTNQFI